jgi:hypothetical protein
MDGFGGLGTRPDCGYSEALPDDCFGKLYPSLPQLPTADAAHNFLSFQKIATATGSASCLRRIDTAVSVQKALLDRHAHSVRATIAAVVTIC